MYQSSTNWQLKPEHIIISVNQEEKCPGGQLKTSPDVCKYKWEKTETNMNYCALHTMDVIEV